MNLNRRLLVVEFQQNNMNHLFSPLLGLHRILSQKPFYIFVKFLVFKFLGRQLLCKAVCFLDSGLRLRLLVELLYAVPIVLLSPVKTAEIRSIQRNQQ
jgi:hypothetical protein